MTTRSGSTSHSTTPCASVLFLGMGVPADVDAGQLLQLVPGVPRRLEPARGARVRPLRRRAHLATDRVLRRRTSRLLAHVARPALVASLRPEEKQEGIWGASVDRCCGVPPRALIRTDQATSYLLGSDNTYSLSSPWPIGGLAKSPADVLNEARRGRRIVPPCSYSSACRSCHRRSSHRCRLTY
jgi:hypothetical protein